MTRPITSYICSQAEPLRALLERLGQRVALSQGRVFVDGQRAEETEGSVAAGARVEVYAPRDSAPKLRVLRVHAGLAFVEKPVGVATEPELRGNQHSVVAQFAREHGCPVREVHALSRLDVAVSGVVLLGLDAKAKQRVTALRARGFVRRRYVALAHNVPQPGAGAWNDAIARKSSGPRRSAGAQGEPAETRYLAVGTAAAPRTECVLALEPITGRTHQLRVHASAHGAPLLGDKTYGGSNRLLLSTGEVTPLDRVFLHAAWIRVGETEPVVCDLPEEFALTWQLVGGASEALVRAVEPAPLPEAP